MKIAFFGLPLGACLLHQDGHELVIACLSRTDTAGIRRIVRYVGASKVVLRPKLDKTFAEKVAALEPDLVVSWFWTSKIPPNIIGSASLGGFGVHPSLLPRHRGPDPTYWAIREGDAETGVTAHRLAEEYDTGAILAHERVAIDDRWNALELARALDRPSLRILRDVARKFSIGVVISESPQIEDRASLAPFPSEAEQVIRWSHPTDEILRQIRALSPAPGAVTEINGRTIAISRAGRSPIPSQLETPGEAICIGEHIVVRTGDAAIAVYAAEADGVALEPAELRRLL